MGDGPTSSFELTRSTRDPSASRVPRPHRALSPTRAARRSHAAQAVRLGCSDCAPPPAAARATIGSATRSMRGRLSCVPCAHGEGDSWRLDRSRHRRGHRGVARGRGRVLPGGRWLTRVTGVDHPSAARRVPRRRAVRMASRRGDVDRDCRTDARGRRRCGRCARRGPTVGLALGNALLLLASSNRGSVPWLVVGLAGWIAGVVIMAWARRASVPAAARR